jgi:hypothetical protein
MDFAQTILLVLSFAFGIFVIVFALNCLKRLGGKLKRSVIYLILAMGVYLVKGVLDFFFMVSENFYVVLLVKILVILFVFLAIVNIAQMIKIIDGEYKTVLKKEKQNGKKK